MAGVILIIAIIFSLSFTHSVYAKSFSAKYCNDEKFTCYTVKRHDTWKKLFPDESKRDLVMRINRINISLHPGMKIAIPNSESVNMLDYAPISTQIDSSGKKTIIISKQDLAFGAYDENGNLVYWGPVSTGKGYCPDIRRNCGTMTGTFRIYNKGGPGCVSSKFPVGRGGAPMPYCMFFHGGFAMHGSYEVPGYHASHGCVRMFVNDAKWLNQEFTSGEKVTVVIRK